jgi:hypothetical protein
MVKCFAVPVMALAVLAAFGVVVMFGPETPAYLDDL